MPRPSLAEYLRSQEALINWLGRQSKRLTCCCVIAGIGWIVLLMLLLFQVMQGHRIFPLGVLSYLLAFQVVISVIGVLGRLIILCCQEFAASTFTQMGVEQVVVQRGLQPVPVDY